MEPLAQDETNPWSTLGLFLSTNPREPRTIENVTLPVFCVVSCRQRNKILVQNLGEWVAASPVPSEGLSDLLVT